MDLPRILVTGAAGRTGGAVADLLLDQGAHVRALVRTEDGRSERLRRRGAEIVVGDLFDTTSLAEALRGVQRAYFVPPWNPYMLDAGAAFATAARGSKLESLVWLTQWLANPISPSPATRQHHLIDQILWMLPNLTKTCLNPGYFADSYLRTMDFAAHLGLFPSPTGSSRNAPPSTEDIARVAVAALTDPGRHDGRTYRPTGPEVLDAAQMAGIISGVLDRPVRHLDLPEWMFLRAAKVSGVGPIELLNVGHYLAEHRRGTFALGAPTDDVATVTGTPAEPFATTAARYAAMPFAARTRALQARTMMRMMRIGLIPTPNAARQARTLGLPQPTSTRPVHRHPGLAKKPPLQQDSSGIEGLVMTAIEPSAAPAELTALLEGNARYAAGAFPGPLPIIPAQRTVILSCVDPRVDPARILDLDEGDAVVIRNVGGRVTPALFQTMAMLQAVSRADARGPAPAEAWTFLVLQHTDCGITRLADRPDLLAPYFGIGLDEVTSRDVTDPDAAVAGDMARLREVITTQFTVAGMVHDLTTGQVRVINHAI